MMRHAAVSAWIAAALCPQWQAAMAGEADITLELQRQIVRCWNIPPDTSPTTDPVTLTFTLDRAGNVTSVPTIVENPDVLEYSKAFVISASKAIETCAPYRLPPGDYDLWKEVKITFRPPEN